MSRRRVDQAMKEERPEKQTLRQLWTELVRKIEHSAVPPALYLTLPGSEGRDILHLVDHGIIHLTEVGAISDDDKDKLLAVEASPNAVLDLQRRFPGLRILEENIQSLVHGDDLTRWPMGDHEQHCRARVVNLDLNTALLGTLRQQQLRFPVLDWITKLAQLHARTPYIEWCLCLTLQGEIQWAPQVSVRVRDFLAENFGREEAYSNACRDFLGLDLHERIASGRPVNFRDLPRAKQQGVLMALVPKKISSLVHPQGWRVITRRNLRYRGAGGAPMVTWIMDFEWDEEASSKPESVYNASLREVLAARGKIEEDGSLS